jgi:NAD+ diphosphatase
MLQDISPYELNNHFDPEKKPGDTSFVVCFRKNGPDKEVLIRLSEDKDNIALPVKAELSGVSELVYLFSVGDEEYFYSEAEVPAPEGCEYVKFMGLRREKTGPKHRIFALYTAYHLSEWYESSRFCGRCGEKTVNDKTERARLCPKCGSKIYPRINPAVIIGVTDKETNKLILTKYRTGFAQNALVAGFTEIGETLEETVKREVMEEVGLEVTNVRYYKSQPWGVALDILAGFFCDVVGDKEIKMDASELKYAEWVAPKDIVLQTTNYSLTNEMMGLFKDKGYQGTI